MSRDISQRFALWAHDKSTFDVPFSFIRDDWGYPLTDIITPLERTIDNCSDIVYPLKKQTYDDALTLAGDFPNNITEWLWSVPGKNEDNSWALLCRLNTGAYAFYTASGANDGFDYNGMMWLSVASSLAEIIEHTMDSYYYRHYMMKTTTDSSLVSLECDKSPHEGDKSPHEGGLNYSAV